MIELKIFHDRAKKQKQLLAIEFKKNRDQKKKNYTIKKKFHLKIK